MPEPECPKAMSDPSDPLSSAPPVEPALRRGPRHHPNVSPPLSTRARILLLILGWLLILVGLAGLVLPGVQGVITLIFGGAVLSLVSPTMHRVMRWTFRPWPRGWRRLLRLRTRVHGWFVE